MALYDLASDICQALAGGPRAVLMMNLWHPGLAGDEVAQADSLERFNAHSAGYTGTL